MNIIKVKDFDSMQSITVSLARNGYLVTADCITDENYKDHWEIKYCEFSEMKEKPIVKDHDYISSMEIHNNNCTKGVNCKILPDEKPLEENDDNDNDPAFKPVLFDEKGNIIKNEKVNPNPYGLMPRDNTPDIKSIPQQDVSYNTKDIERKLLSQVKIN